MKRSRRTEIQIGAEKRAKERMKRFEENQAAIKEEKKKPKKEKVEEDDGVRCMTAWQKKEGDGDWKEIHIYYKVDKRGKFLKKIESDEE